MEKKIHFFFMEIFRLCHTFFLFLYLTAKKIWQTKSPKANKTKLLHTHTHTHSIYFLLLYIYFLLFFADKNFLFYWSFFVFSFLLFFINYFSLFIFHCFYSGKTIFWFCFLFVGYFAFVVLLQNFALENFSLSLAFSLGKFSRFSFILCFLLFNPSLYYTLMYYSIFPFIYFNCIYFPQHN